MTTTTSSAVPSIDELAQEAVRKYQQQRGAIPTDQGMGGQQLSAEEQARFLGGAFKWVAENVIPAVLPHFQNMLTGQQRALGVPETRGDEEERGFFDFAKKALSLVAPFAQQALQGILAPRQRDINEDATTTDRFAFLAALVPTLVSAAGSVIGGLLSGKRGPLTVDDEQDRLILSQFTTNCWNSLTRPEVLASLKPVLASAQRPSTSSQPSQPSQPQPQPQPQPATF